MQAHQQPEIILNQAGGDAEAAGPAAFPVALAVAPMAAQPAVNVAMNEPAGVALNYIYTPHGIYNVPLHFVVRDHNNPIVVRPRAWHDVRAKHRQLTAGTFLEGKEVCLTNIIAVSNAAADDYETSRRPLRVLWFIRISVQSGCSAFESTFGDNFLWQLPHSVCARVVAGCRAYERANNLPLHLRSRMLTDFRATHHGFKPADFPEFERLSKIDDYYDRVFAMSVIPTAAPVAALNENPAPFIKSLARGWRQQPYPGRLGAIDWTTAPCDLTNLILSTAIKQLIHTPDNNDWKAFLAMRAVSREWRDKCNAEGTKMVRDLAADVKRSLRSLEVERLLEVRNRVLDKGIMTIHLLLDSQKISIYNLMRLRAVKKPGSMPPGRVSGPEPVDRKPSMQSQPSTKRARVGARAQVPAELLESRSSRP